MTVLKPSYLAKLRKRLDKKDPPEKQEQQPPKTEN
jgi:hypothetical protein